MSKTQQDRFFVKNHPGRPQPARVPFALRKGDRLLLIGDSITEACRYSRMVETYLSVCAPDLEVEVRNIGKGGETAEGFLQRIETDCLSYQPTAATICYGMNDAGYANDNREAAEKFRLAGAEIARKLKAAGVRVVYSSPGCIGRLPPWDFIAEQKGTLDGLNTSLMYMRDHAAAIAEAEQLPFVDHFWNLYQARFESASRFGPDYAVCGGDDGVHPSWAGHVVMAYGFFQALGFDGDLGNFTIDLAARTAKASAGHQFVSQADGIYTFTSRNYPFCAEGLPDKDWSIRSGMALVPFNRDFNRMTLKVTGASAPRYRVVWTNSRNVLEEWHTYTGAELSTGINLADEFHINPFSIYFNRVDDLVSQKQAVEADETWRIWEREDKPGSRSLAECEARYAELLKAIEQAFVPVTHNIRVEAL